MSPAVTTPPLATPWVPLWPLAPSRLGELAYAERTTPYVLAASSTDADAVTILTAPAITLDGNTDVVIEFYSEAFIPAQTLGANVIANIWDGATDLGRIAAVITGIATPSGNMAATATGARRLRPSAGAHTYSVKIWGVAGGTVNAGPGGAAQAMPAFVRVSLASPLLTAPPGAAVAVQYGTSLPTSPLDGQEAILVDSLTNPSYQWRFRYNAGSASAYKWEFVGGAPRTAERVGPAAGFANTTYAVVGSGQLIVPRDGDYDTHLSLNLWNNTVGAYTHACLAKSVAHAADSLAVVIGNFGTVNVVTHAARAKRLTGLTAGELVEIYGRATAGLASYERMYFSITPVRVS